MIKKNQTKYNMCVSWLINQCNSLIEKDKEYAKRFGSCEPANTNAVWSSSITLALILWITNTWFSIDQEKGKENEGEKDIRISSPWREKEGIIWMITKGSQIQLQ